jgi:uncharacterized protein YjgD (DUF1641 family)
MMDDSNNIQSQINDINRKLDLLLGFMQEQQLKSARTDDLLADLAIVGKDIYDTTVTELDNYSVELDPEQLKVLTIKLLKNIPTFIKVVDTMESMNDLARDAGPMINEMIIDFTKKLHELESRGYFTFFKETGKVLDNVVTHFTAEDVNRLADNIVTILLTVKNFTQPEVLNGINNAVKVFNSLAMEKLPEYSVWRLIREMRTPEMKRGIAFIVTFMKNMANTANS